MRKSAAIAGTSPGTDVVRLFASDAVVVTGAAAGAVAHCSAREGARIWLIVTDAKTVETVVREEERLDGEGLAPPLDFAAEDRFGLIDIWVNDAKATVFSPISEVTPDEFRRTIEATYLCFVHGSMAALRQLRARGRATFVQVEPVAARSTRLVTLLCRSTAIS